MREPSMAITFSSAELEPHEAALTATRRAGCTCDPEIEIEGKAITIKHDYKCPVLRRRDG
jgi:hypothetical protein